MRVSAFYGPIILLLWQAAPIAVRPDATGHLRLSIGYGVGGYDSHADQVNCEGKVLKESHLAGERGGPTGELEVWPAANLRLNAFASSMSGSLSDSHAPRNTAYQQRASGALVAVEGGTIGLGAGVASVTGTDPATVGLGYLRVGPIDRTHLRLEIVPPELPTEPFLLRAGIGVNQGLLGGGRLKTGITLTEPRGDVRSHAGLFAEGIFPTGNPHLELRLSGRIGFGQMYHPSVDLIGNYTAWGISAGLRYSL